MPNAFTHYWTEKRNDDKQGLPLRHVASNDFRSRGVQQGDSIFCITQHEGTLYLIARMIVDQVTDAKSAADQVGGPVGFTDRHDHCVCSAHHGSPIQFDREIPPAVVGQLRFVRQSGRETGIALTPAGDVKRQAMRKVRRLTAASAGLLNSIVDA